MFKLLLPCAAAAVLSTAPALAQDLSLGDPAPELVVSRWVKGDPVPSFETGAVYVVEFWATWCLPCRASIPHLTELQAQYAERGVRVVGVSIWDNADKVEGFVEQMGERMNYTVAKDQIPAGGGRRDGVMAKTWMDAAERNEIPTAFIVDGKGRVVWIGHPLAVDGPLAQVVDGSWDLQAAIAEQAAEKLRLKVLKEAEEKVYGPLKRKDYRGALAAIDEILAVHPQLESEFGVRKFEALLKLKSYARAFAYARRLTLGVYHDDPMILNQIAWTIADPDDATLAERDFDVALLAARRACELTAWRDAAILDTLAAAHFGLKDLPKAIEIQLLAVEASIGTEFEPELKRRLEHYKKALEKQQGLAFSPD